MSQRIYSGQFWLLFAISFGFVFTMNAYLILQVHITALGGGATDSNLILSSAIVVAVIVRLSTATWIDTFGRKRLLMAGVIISLLSSIGFVFATSIELLSLARAFQGLAFATVFSVSLTMIHDIAPAHRQAAMVAAFGISGHLAGSSAPAIADLIYERGMSSLPEAASSLDIHNEAFLPIVLITVGIGVVITGLTFFVKETAARTRAGNRPKFAWLVAIFRRRLNRPLILATLLFGVFSAALMFNVLRYAESQGWASGGAYFIAYGGMAALIRIFFRNLPDRVGLTKVLMPSYLAMVLAVILLASVPSPAILIVAGLLGGLGHAYVFPILSVLLVRRQPDRFRGTTVALYGSMIDLGTVIGSLLVGRLIDWIIQLGLVETLSMRLTFWAIGAIMLVVWLYLVFGERAIAQRRGLSSYGVREISPVVSLSEPKGRYS